MTVGGWILFIVLSLIILACGLSFGIIFGDGEPSGYIIGSLVSIILIILLLVGMFWYYNNTASGARAYKTQESNFNMGIERKVTVYDMTGKVIQIYEGKFDVEYDDDRILFDDEKGLRHIIYYPTGTVIIDEVQ